ncbi:unnamed protein product [Penicillium olsonii]|nr:unnamed protein product [Penicillium olsonii]
MGSGLRGKAQWAFLGAHWTPNITNIDVFAVAKQLAISVSYVHTMGFVHKNIRPETILIFDNGVSQLGSLALVGFRSVRMADGNSLRQGDDAWDQNLYRHPDRQGVFPEAYYTMQHDIYSLGVCMLEIGLWRSFIAYNKRGEICLAESKEALDIGKTKSVDGIVRLATEVLPRRMGDKFARVVVNCLTCMDETNCDFGDNNDFQDEDGVLIGVKYIEKGWLSRPGIIHLLTGLCVRFFSSLTQYHYDTVSIQKTALARRSQCSLCSRRSEKW